MTPKQKRMKRAFDVIGASLGLFITWPIILIAWLIASIETRSNGFFLQKRVGERGELFTIIKIKTMYPHAKGSSITTAKDKRITKSGRFFRRYKIDELPQLINILKGDMSFVGPRPDVPGYMDRLEGNDRVLLSIKPGITGPATLKYRDEEEILAKVDDPQKYNDEVIWPDKVRINKQYLRNWSLKKDIEYILQTIKGK
ncbi:sugar transferase [Nitratiruptor tergarcus]|uniref:Sugar transferase involved in LPS biosynthesis (Colanic, teichoic acid) n=1 Tax=Nitratiruptor tergarcus DSM 16512 TaxID=1069081 RepID=A0A1W1WUP9_9BACT|nr:sugar transferase [Nitratiruptor tergarcus]SMC09966.1 Sugar transferase involved in LPS biosynthesis (colanic, teichoic acid) [Nitratiruptor tergarcus DSM 16512]